MGINAEYMGMLATSLSALQDRILCAEGAALLSEQTTLGNTVVNAVAHLATLTAELQNSNQTYFCSAQTKKAHLSFLSQTVGAPETSDRSLGFNYNRLQLNKVLISQALSKNNNIFNKNLLIKMQRSDPSFRELMNTLTNDQEPDRQGFKLLNGVLYKQATSSGQSYFRLCIPPEICKDIVFYMQHLHNMHFAAHTTQ